MRLDQDGRITSKSEVLHAAAVRLWWSSKAYSTARTCRSFERPSRDAARSTRASERPPSLGETLMRVLLLGSTNTSDAARAHADLIVKPRNDGVGLLEFHQIDPPAKRVASRHARRSSRRLRSSSAPRTSRRPRPRERLQRSEFSAVRAGERAACRCVGRLRGLVARTAMRVRARRRDHPVQAILRIDQRLSSVAGRRKCWRESRKVCFAA